jgi:tetratricopeptide (TPR) repeat protein
MKTLTIHLMMIAFLAAPAAARGADDPGAPGAGGPQPADPYLEEARAAIAYKNWARATEVLRDALAKDAGNPDYHNLYAYSVRMGPQPAMDVVFKHYHEALRIDPKHRGAHEYIGEAYLMVGNAGKAKEHLKALDGLCFFGCQEYSMLKKAIADFEAKRTK